MIFIFAILSFSGIDIMLGVIGGTIGFLIWNWHPAKVFMGELLIWLQFTLVVY